jgi:hypothetical protein
LEHFKKLHENLKFHQNKCHPGGVPNMRRQCAKTADQWTPREPASPTLQPLVVWLRGDTLREVVQENPKLKVGGG